MNELLESFTRCPYCGENISLLIDTSQGEHQYIEDCEVCCRPINVVCQSATDGELELQVFQENEA